MEEVVVKGKRTKRQRLLRPPAPLAASPSTSSTEFSATTTEEEEDMANCLILLAQGRALDATSNPVAVAVADGGGGGGGGGAQETLTTRNCKAEFYVYECKTCNKCFPSFQALGGHRASHKKSKNAVGANGDGLHDLSMNSFSKPFLAPVNNNNKNKIRVHECLICGSEFTSGQALGGHMRRHRPGITAESSPDSKKERNMLSLDLNLPAPSDGSEFSELPFAGGERRLAFSASAMVGCHY